MWFNIYMTEPLIQEFRQAIDVDPRGAAIVHSDALVEVLNAAEALHKHGRCCELCSIWDPPFDTCDCGWIDADLRWRELGGGIG